ncbi:hypothetical protein [Nitrobacter sp. TKz-YC02]
MDFETLVGKPNPELQTISFPQKIMLAIVAGGTAILTGSLFLLIGFK